MHTGTHIHTRLFRVADAGEVRRALLHSALFDIAGVWDFIQSVTGDHLKGFKEGYNMTRFEFLKIQLVCRKQIGAGKSVVGQFGTCHGCPSET